MFAKQINTLLPHISPAILRSLLRAQDRWRAIRGRPTHYPWPRTLTNQRHVTFVQIGANRASINDPIFRQIVQRGWKGILVEPQTAAMDHLKQSLRHFPNLHFEEVAIADRSEERPFYFIESSISTPTWVHQMSSLRAGIPGQITEAIPHAQVGSKQIPCLTLHELLEKYQINQFDVLVIDTEGLDAEILHTLDLDLYRPVAICFEHYHLSHAEWTSIIQKLHQFQYRTEKRGYDTIAIKKQI